MIIMIIFITNILIINHHPHHNNDRNKQHIDDYSHHQEKSRACAVQTQQAGRIQNSNSISIPDYHQLLLFLLLPLLIIIIIVVIFITNVLIIITFITIMRKVGRAACAVQTKQAAKIQNSKCISIPNAISVTIIFRRGTSHL